MTEIVEYTYGHCKTPMSTIVSKYSSPYYSQMHFIHLSIAILKQHLAFNNVIVLDRLDIQHILDFNESMYLKQMLLCNVDGS